MVFLLALGLVLIGVIVALLADVVRYLWDARRQS